MIIGKEKKWNKYLIIMKKGGENIKLSSQNSNMLFKLLNDKKYKSTIINLLSDILSLNIKNYEKISIERFEDISEYEFSLIKIRAELVNKTYTDIHLKMINREKVKENIFCYWSLIYQNELDKKYKKEKSKPIVSKVTITDIGKERYKSSILLELQDNPINVLEYGAEMHFVDVIEYINKTQKKHYKFGEIENFISDKDENLLLVGLILNKSIGRSNIELI